MHVYAAETTENRFTYDIKSERLINPMTQSEYSRDKFIMWGQDDYRQWKSTDPRDIK